MIENDPMDLYGTNADHSVIQEKENKVDRENDELRSKSKPLHELVQTVKFRVDNVLGIIDRYPYMGGGSLDPDIYGPKLILNGTPDLQIDTRILTFYGSSIVKAGDWVSAKIPIYKKIDIFGKNIPGKLRDYQSFYIGRNFELEEKVIELSLINDDKILRIYQAFDYFLFQK